MKRSLALCLLTLLLALPGQARLKLGVRGGFNITQMAFNKDVIESSNRQGFFVGPVFHLSLPTGLGFELAGLYDQRDSRMNGETVVQKFVNVPLNLRLTVGLGSKAGIYLATGPQVAFNVGDKEFSLKNVTNGELLEEAKTYRLRDSNFSVNFGGGVYFSKHFEVGFTYNMAVGKTGELRDMNLEEELGKSHAHAWQIHATYFF